MRCQQVYYSVDIDRSGTLDLNELGRAMQAFGFQLDMSPQGSFYTLCKSFDFQQQGKFNLDVYIAMVVMVTNCKRMFDMFSRGGPQVQRAAAPAATFGHPAWARSSRPLRLGPRRLSELRRS